MITIEIPDFGTLELEHLVLDFNGTMAVDGRLVDGVAERIRALSKHLALHVVTADTFGRVRRELEGLPCSVDILPPGEQGLAKATFVGALGEARTACFGNGRNDAVMLERAALGVAVMLDEGASRDAFLAADLIAPSITAAFDLLLEPLRLVATLRK
jgi:soluble P-type ATPase